MELIVLGADGTWPRRGGACSGYLLRHDGFTLWVDLGAGTLANLQEHAGLLDVGALVVSHAHPDHLVDLFPYFYARRYGLGNPTGTPLHCAPVVPERIGALLPEEGRRELAESFAVTEVEPGGSFEAGPFRVATAPMAHPVPTLGVRVEADGRAVAYTADSGPTPQIPRLARNADVLLAEATWQRDDGTPHPPDVHMTAREAGEAARDAAVGRLVLTHVWPTLDRDRSVEEAAGAYGGEILVADVGVKLEVGS